MANSILTDDDIKRLQANTAARDAANAASLEQATGMLTRGKPAFKTTMPKYTIAPYIAPDPPPQSGGGGGGGSVVCTKLYKLGYCDKELYHAEHKWGYDKFTKDPFNQYGYYWWGKPLARTFDKKTRKGRFMIALIRPLFMATALENSRKYGVIRERSFIQKWVGKAIVYLVLEKGNTALGHIRMAFFTPKEALNVV